MCEISLAGRWLCDAGDARGVEITLPGTLDENGIGNADAVSKPWHPDVAEAGGAGLNVDGVIANRLTRRYTLEGPATFTRTLDWQVPAGKRLFVVCERSRRLTLTVNGQAAPVFTPGTVSTPYVFEVTGLMTGRDTLTLTADNTYPGWPGDDITCASAATDETQTNWNGVLGDLRLWAEEKTFVRQVRAYPRENRLTVRVDVSCGEKWRGAVRVSSPALAEDAEQIVSLTPGEAELVFDSLPLRRDVRRWDEEQGALYPLTVRLGDVEAEITFGVRDFTVKDGRLTLNGRGVFLRGEANCAMFPETGHPPMTVEAWTDVLTTYRAYGVNCVRFHSHCPPEAAFTAADRLGMLMQPELSHWNPRTAFESDESFAYYTLELEQLLRCLANHPSFVMLTLGNELHTNDLGRRRMSALLRQARALDPTRLYADGSNTFYGWKGCDPDSDFFTSSNFYEHELRATNSGMAGWLNHEYPNARHTYNESMAAIRASYPGAVFGFEVGQYEVLPDFDELADFRGATIPANYRLIRDRVEQRGLMPEWKRRVEATGEMSLQCYRAEVEATLRTEGMSGLSLLGLQDFPGQGTALVGMLNAHLRAKPFPFARPERFRAFFTGTLPLALLERFTWEAGETLRVPLQFASDRAEPLTGRPVWSLEGGGSTLRGELPEVTARGRLSPLGEAVIPLRGFDRPVRLMLTVAFAGFENRYPLWVYPPVTPRCPENVHTCACLDDEALRVLAAGGRIYLSPPSTKEALPASIQAQFSPDFWSVGTFANQEGGMGQLIDERHPIFRDFPTAFYSEWQWWPMASQRAIILPERWPAIVTVMDSYAKLRPMAQLLECRVGGGRLMLSSMGLQELQQYPEARALQAGIYHYMASEDFQPALEVAVEDILALTRTP